MSGMPTLRATRVALRAALLVCVLFTGSIAPALAEDPSVAEEPVEKPSVANPGCLAYGPALVDLTGTLDTELYPTAPGYGEKPSDERLESVFVLTLDRAICAGTESDVTTVQVEQKKVSAFRLRHFTGKHVLVKGMLFNAKTQHHHTRVVLTVQAIKRS